MCVTGAIPWVRQSDLVVVSSSSSVFVLNTANYEDGRALGSIFNDCLSASQWQIQVTTVSKKPSHVPKHVQGSYEEFVLEP